MFYEEKYEEEFREEYEDEFREESEECEDEFTSDSPPPVRKVTFPGFSSSEESESSEEEEEESPEKPSSRPPETREEKRAVPPQKKGEPLLLPAPPPGPSKDVPSSEERTPKREEKPPLPPREESGGSLPSLPGSPPPAPAVETKQGIVTFNGLGEPVFASAIDDPLGFNVSTFHIVGDDLRKTKEIEDRYQALFSDWDKAYKQNVAPRISNLIGKRISAGPNKHKNFYRDILPNDFSIFRFPEAPGTNETERKYMNANWVCNIFRDVPLRLIASQGPSFVDQSPEDSTMDEFLEMIHTTGASVISLGGEIENGTSKFDQFWHKTTSLFSSTLIESKEEIARGNRMERMEKRQTSESGFWSGEMKVTDLEQKKWEEEQKVPPEESTAETQVNVYHYFAWPDHGVPDLEKFKHFMEFLEEELRSNFLMGRSLIVHCSAGAGRTGTLCFILLLWLHAKEMFRKSGPCDFTLDVNCWEYLNALRRRRKSLIQEAKQFTFALKMVYALVHDSYLQARIRDVTMFPESKTQNPISLNKTYDYDEKDVTLQPSFALCPTYVLLSRPNLPPELDMPGNLKWRACPHDFRLIEFARSQVYQGLLQKEGHTRGITMDTCPRCFEIHQGEPRPIVIYGPERLIDRLGEVLYKQSFTFKKIMKEASSLGLFLFSEDEEFSAALAKVEMHRPPAERTEFDLLLNKAIFSEANISDKIADVKKTDDSSPLFPKICLLKSSNPDRFDRFTFSGPQSLFVKLIPGSKTGFFPTPLYGTVADAYITFNTDEVESSQNEALLAFLFNIQNLLTKPFTDSSNQDIKCSQIKDEALPLLNGQDLFEEFV